MRVDPITSRLVPENDEDREALNMPLEENETQPRFQSRETVATQQDSQDHGKILAELAEIKGAVIKPPSDDAQHQVVLRSLAALQARLEAGLERIDEIAERLNVDEIETETVDSNPDKVEVTE